MITVRGVLTATQHQTIFICFIHFFLLFIDSQTSWLRTVHGKGDGLHPGSAETLLPGDIGELCRKLLLPSQHQTSGDV